MTPTVTINEQGIKALLAAGQATAVLREAATVAVGEMDRLAPKGFMGYKRGLAVGKSHELDGVAAVDIILGYGWNLVEYGTATTPPHRVAERGIRNVGLKFVEGSK